MLSNHFTLTKCHLGILLVLGGIAAFVVILRPDLIEAGRTGGIGPAQRTALIGAALIALVGLTLIPLGDQTA